MIGTMDEQTEQFRAFIERITAVTGLSPTEIAKRAGVAATTITRPFYKPETAGPPTLRTIAKIVAATGVSFDMGAESVSSETSSTTFVSSSKSDVVMAPHVRVPALTDLPRDLPIRGIAACSSGDGAFQFGANPVDWARRPPAFNGVREAYALYMSGDSMEPRLFQGDLVMVHPSRPVRPGDLAIFILKDGSNEPEYSFCKVFVSDRGGVVTVRQYNPEMTREFPHEHILARHRVMEMADLFGA